MSAFFNLIMVKVIKPPLVGLSTEELVGMLKPVLSLKLLISCAQALEAQEFYDFCQWSSQQTKKTSISGKQDANLNVKNFADEITLMNTKLLGLNEELRQFNQQSQDFDKQDENGRTVLSHLCERRDRGAIRGVQLLLRHKNRPDVNIADKNGVTCLMHACRVGNESVIFNLMKFSDVNQADNRGRTALHYAAEAGHGQICSTLSKKGKAKVNLQSAKVDGSSSALHLACDNEHTEVIELLLNLKANPEQMDKEGRTALLRSVKENKLHSVRCLLGNLAHVTDPADVYKKRMMDYAGPRMHTVLDNRIHGYEMPQKFRKSIHDKLETLGNWMNFHQNDQKLLAVLELCDHDQDLAMRRLSDEVVKTGHKSSEQIIDQLVMKLQSK